MASGDAARTSLNSDETTAPPPGMYWVQMQGLWALRPIVDDHNHRGQINRSQHPEGVDRSTLEQQRAPLTEADRQWLAQSAGAACSAGALTEASMPASSTPRPEQLPGTQGVIEFRHQHCAPSFAAAVARDTVFAHPQPSTQPLLPSVSLQPQNEPDPDYQGWPDWLLQWGRRVEDEEGSDHAPGTSASPSAPPSPPGTPQRSMVKVALAPMRPSRLQRPTLAQGYALGPRGESPLRMEAGSRLRQRSGACPCHRRHLSLTIQVHVSR